MAVLVTGGAGYIGSHTCVELLNAGRSIVVVDNFVNSKYEAIRRIQHITGKTFPFYRINLVDRTALEQVFTENKIVSVVHFAGLKAVAESVRKPLLYYHNNLTGTIHLLQLMAKYDVKKIVFSSSATVYGLNAKPPCKETDPTGATNPYGRTKLFIEQILTDVWKSDNLWSVVLLRYFNPIGAHESGLIGEDPNGIPNNLVPFIAQVAIGKLPQLEIFGNDYDTIDGTGVRDYIHVLDLAQGHLCALDYCMEHTGVETVNLGTGNGYSVLQVVEAFEKASGKTIKKEVVGRREGDIAVCFADASKALSLFGWKAKLDIDRMCADTWRFRVQNPDGLPDSESAE
jgi:UDP-glucose 4-epimerase